MKGALSRAGTQGQKTARRGFAKASQMVHSAASIAERVVCNPDPDEIEPKPVQKKPIISVNGQDVDRSFAKKGTDLPKRSAA